MRLPRSLCIPTTLTISFALLSAFRGTHATPFPRDDTLDTPDHEAPANATLEIRQSCAVPCGYYHQLCCSSGQSCYTDGSGQAQCGPAGGNGGAGAAQGGSNGQYQVYTTTYIETGLLTVTTTYSQLIANVATGAAAPQGSNAACNVQMGYTQCGGTCCSPGEFCNQPGQCVGAAGTTGGAVAPTNSAFIRPTSGTVATVTEVGTATTTLPFQTPVGTDGAMLAPISATPANNGLSAGAIAGIVIGVLFGLFLLFLLLAFLCCRGIWDAIFGRRKKRTTETYIEEHHSHHGSGRPQRKWFGILPAGRPSRPPPPKKSSGGMGVLGVGGFLAALAVLLGLKRRRDHRVNDEKSSYTGSSYTYSDDYTTSESSASSDRRTRDTRRSRR